MGKRIVVNASPKFCKVLKRLSLQTGPTVRVLLSNFLNRSYPVFLEADKFHFRTPDKGQYYDEGGLLKRRTRKEALRVRNNGVEPLQLDVDIKVHRALKRLSVAAGVTIDDIVSGYLERSLPFFLGFEQSYNDLLEANSKAILQGLSGKGAGNGGTSSGNAFLNRRSDV